MRCFRENPPEELDPEPLNEEQLKALESDIRRKIVSMLAEEPLYPSKAAREFNLSKQRAHYHFKKLREADIISKLENREKSGGKAKLYGLEHGLFYYDSGAEGQRAFLPSRNDDIEELFEPAIKEDKIDLNVVVGSADPHGEDQVRARDGHLSGEITGRLGNYGRISSPKVVLDTEVKRDDLYEENMILVGGILTNTVSKEFNSLFPSGFEEESFPYRELHTPEKDYTDSNVGVVSKIPNPRNEEKFVMMLAGIRQQGTRAAVLAFNEIEKIASKINQNGYTVVSGLDENGDGKIDDFEVLE